jgi:hypothetical protein
VSNCCFLFYLPEFSQEPNRKRREREGSGSETWFSDTRANNQQKKAEAGANRILDLFFDFRFLRNEPPFFFIFLSLTNYWTRRETMLWYVKVYDTLLPLVRWRRYVLLPRGKLIKFVLIF